MRRKDSQVMCKVEGMTSVPTRYGRVIQVHFWQYNKDGTPEARKFITCRSTNGQIFIGGTYSLEFLKSLAIQTQ